MDERKIVEDKDRKKYITYQNMFWIFMIGSVVGLILEGIWNWYKFGYWESHVNTIWGPFCLIYGVGVVGLYIGSVLMNKKNIVVKFLNFALIASVVELLCGYLLKYGMGMRAWNYSRHFMNIDGMISLKMTLMWGVIGIVYGRFIVPRFDHLFDKLNGKTSKIICIALTVFMAINIVATICCMVRWRQRHLGINAKTQAGRLIDRVYGDKQMSKKLCEWYF